MDKKGLSIVEIERMLREGKAPDDIKEIDDLPDENAKANLERCMAKVERRKKVN